MSSLEALTKIHESLTEALKDADKFDKGNDTAGRRLRKTALEASKALGQLRKDVQETRNERKTG
jgi:hypothetical protein